MKRITISALLVATFAAYAIYVKISSPDAVPVLVTKETSVLPISRATPTPRSAPNGGQYRDGEYTGNVEDAYYGNVQVKVSISNGKISNVQFLDYPQDRETSVRINSRATPVLRQEAIQAQSANVDIVSGATATSEAFIQSLLSALSQAI
jgi:uncharacterized protein with FMN-binding domain